MMQRFLIAFVSIFLLLSCSKEENLAVEMFGEWQLTEMWNGDEVEPHSDIFYGFQNGLIQIVKTYQGIENRSIIYRGRYWCEADSLYFVLLDGGETVISDFKLEGKTGEEHINKFKIEKLTKSKMVWSRDTVERFVFRSY